MPGRSTLLPARTLANKFRTCGKRTSVLSDQSLKAMGESFRDVEPSAILRCQFYGGPLLEGGRIRTQVNDHVVEPPRLVQRTSLACA